MRSMELKLEPAKIQITEEEILADLRYPTSRERPVAPPEAKRG